MDTPIRWQDARLAGSCRQLLAISRRRFLSACGALTMARSGWAAAVNVPPPALRLSTSSNHFRSLSIEEACRRIAALGFEGIDIWSDYEGCPHLDDALDRLGGRDELQVHIQSELEGGFIRIAVLGCGRRAGLSQAAEVDRVFSVMVGLR